MPEEQMEQIGEQLLWEMCLSGDERAYSCIYRKYIDILFSYGMRFTPDRELIKDAIQDVFMKIFTNRSNLKKTDRLKPYLFMALKNKLFNVFEKEMTPYSIDAVEPVFVTEYSIEDIIIADEQEAERNSKVKRLLDALPPRQKEALYYRYVEELSLAEVSKLMGINYQSVQNLIQRAIKNVRQAYDESKSRPTKIQLVTNYF